MITELDRELQKEFAVEKGREETLKMVAKAMLAKDNHPEEIAEITGLTVEEVLALKS